MRGGLSGGPATDRAGGGIYRQYTVVRYPGGDDRTRQEIDLGRVRTGSERVEGRDSSHYRAVREVARLLRRWGYRVGVVVEASLTLRRSGERTGHSRRRLR